MYALNVTELDEYNHCMGYESYYHKSPNYWGNSSVHQSGLNMLYHRFHFGVLQANGPL